MRIAKTPRFLRIPLARSDPRRHPNAPQAARWGAALLAAALAVAAALAGCATSPSADGVEPGVLLFEGNEAFSEGELRDVVEEDIARLEERGFRKEYVDDLAFEIERFLRDEGHAFAEVAYDYAPGQATLRIREGPRVLIRAIEFVGRRAFTKVELEGLLAEKRTGHFGIGRRLYVERDVRALGADIEDTYRDRGYHEVRVGEPTVTFVGDGREAVVAISIAEGRPYVLESIDTSAVPLLGQHVLFERFGQLRGSAYVPRLRFEVRSGIESLYADAGYPDAVAEVAETADDRPDRVAVTLAATAKPGQAVTIRRVVVKGNESTDTDVVMGRLLVAPGDRFDGSKVRGSYARLFSSGLFKTVRIELAGGEAPGEDAAPAPDAAAAAVERDLIVEVVEKPSMEYFFEAGFGSYDLARARAGVRELNLFGRGIIGRAEVLGSIRGGQVTLGVTEPCFLQTPWSLDLPVTLLYREEPSYTIQEIEVALRGSRPITEAVTVGGTYRFSLSRVTDVDVEEFRFEGDENLQVGALGPFFEFHSWDDLFEPTSGARSRIFAEYGTPFLGGDISFVHGGFGTRHYLGLWSGAVLAGKIDTEWIVPVAGTDSIPIQERLFNGGESSVRSFKQSELGPRDERGKFTGGEVRNTASLELRQQIFGELSTAVFGDYGNTALTAAKPLDDFRPAVGVGLRYGLPVGPIRLDVGFNPAQRPDEDLYVIHVAIGMPF